MMLMLMLMLDAGCWMLDAGWSLRKRAQGPVLDESTVAAGSRWPGDLHS
jgi:hypothetical protein